MHILPTEVPRKWKSPLRETRGQGGGGGGREGGRWSRCGASEGRRRGRRRKEWGVGRVVSYLGSVVAGSGEGCQVRRVAARVETRERSSEIPSRDIGHSLTRPPTALGPSRNTLACCLPGWLLACLPACLLACLLGRLALPTLDGYYSTVPSFCSLFFLPLEHFPKVFFSLDLRRITMKLYGRGENWIFQVFLSLVSSHLPVSFSYRSSSIYYFFFFLLAVNSSDIRVHLLFSILL